MFSTRGCPKVGVHASHISCLRRSLSSQRCDATWMAPLARRPHERWEQRWSAVPRLAQYTNLPTRDKLFAKTCRGNTETDRYLFLTHRPQIIGWVNIFKPKSLKFPVYGKGCYCSGFPRPLACRRLRLPSNKAEPFRRLRLLPQVASLGGTASLLWEVLY